MDKKKILLLSKDDVHAYYIEYMNQLISWGYDVKMIVYNKTTLNDHIIGIRSSDNKWDRICVKIRSAFVYKLQWCLTRKKMMESHCLFDLGFSVSSRVILSRYKEKPELINVLFSSNFINNQTISKLQRKTGAKVLYSMIDNAPITGSCHYPMGCLEYQNECRNCSALRFNLAHRLCKYKVKNLPQASVIQGTSSDCRRAHLSSVFSQKKNYPTITLATYSFCFDKKQVRREWNLQENNFTIFTGATFLDQPRKGFSLFLKAIEMFIANYPNVPLTLIVAGKNPNKHLFGLSVELKYAERFKEEDLFKAYYASDVYVCSSIDDSGPFMINQAFSCNIPIVSFDMGVARDFIVDGENGIIVEDIDEKSLCMAIKEIYEDRQIVKSIKEKNENIKKDILRSKNLEKAINCIINE